MWPFKPKIKYVCNHCGCSIKISHERIKELMRFFDVPNGEILTLECHDCHMGTLLPMESIEVLKKIF